MAEIKAGQYVTDGTSVFILDDIRDGNRVGDIVFRPVLHDGYIKANGATVTASEYPLLLKFAQDNILLVDSTIWNSDKSKYVYDSGADTLKVPDAQGRVLQGTADVMNSIEAGLPNITGDGLTGDGYYDWVGKQKKAIIMKNEGGFLHSAPSSGKDFGAVRLYFDASKSNEVYGASNTVQPPALLLIPQIKY